MGNVVLSKNSTACARDIQRPAKPAVLILFQYCLITSREASAATAILIAGGERRGENAASFRNIQDFRPPPRAGGSRRGRKPKSASRSLAILLRALPSLPPFPFFALLFRRVATDISEAKHASFADAPRTLQINEMSF
jgi:hypothetical protein